MLYEKEKKMDMKNSILHCIRYKQLNRYDLFKKSERIKATLKNLWNGVYPDEERIISRNSLIQKND